jgi:DNA primase
MRIPEAVVEQIKQTADILEVVGDFVSLKKRGTNYTACCPFHNEKSPSFTVNPAQA